MNQEQISKVEQSIENLKNKTSKIYFIVQDTKGNAKASVEYIYNLALALQENGYNPVILHEKPDYVGVSSWLGDKYESLPHQVIEGGNLQVMTSGEPQNVRKQRGLIALFPSYILHQVTPVTQGNRQSLVAWVSGPAFR